MFLAATNVLGAVSHLANIGQVAEVGQSRIHQKEQMEWARRAYRLDSRTLRIEILNAVKEDVRDHHSTYAGRIDTLLFVHTLLLTFALATLQFSDQYVPQTSEVCPECVEAAYPILVSIWVYLIAAILILPFWCILMLLWCKLRLDNWLEKSVRRLNTELRTTLSSEGFFDEDPASLSDAADRELEFVEQTISRLGSFVVDHQDRFAKVWRGECDSMIHATTNLLWVNAVVAVVITAGMFWMFLRNHLEEHQEVAANFLTLVMAGIMAPAMYFGWRMIRTPRSFLFPEPAVEEDYVSCSGLSEHSDHDEEENRGRPENRMPLLPPARGALGVGPQGGPRRSPSRMLAGRLAAATSPALRGAARPPGRLPSRDCFSEASMAVGSGGASGLPERTSSGSGSACSACGAMPARRPSKSRFRAKSLDAHMLRMHQERG